MKINNWTLDEVINYLNILKFAPKDRLDHRYTPRVNGEIFVENGESDIDDIDEFLILDDEKK